MKVLELIPYIGIGRFVFGDKRSELKKDLGEPRSTYMYGYPKEDRFLDNYGIFHILSNRNEMLEAVEIFPTMMIEETWLSYSNIKIQFTTEKKKFLEDMKKIADDLCLDEEGETYFSSKLGLKIYCPYDEIEDVIFHDRHCYDEEKEYIENL